MIYVCRLPEPEGLTPRERSALRHAAAHAMLRQGLEAEYGLWGEDARLERTRWGKPYLPGRPDVQVSLTHCAGLAACAIGGAECGIDAEPVRPLREGVLRRVFTEEERRWVLASADPDWAFFRLWTLKESFVKAQGQGLAYGMERVPIGFGPQGEPRCALPGWRFSQRTLWERYVVSVCVRLEAQTTDLFEKKMEE